MAIVRTLCGQCGLGCGIRAVTGEERDMILEGDRLHPVNGGLLCDKGWGLAAHAALEGRLLTPMINGRVTGSDRAAVYVARYLSGIQARYGPGSVALHLGGDLVTEDHYVANKLLKGFLGSAHVETEWGRSAGTIAAHRAAFGEDVMPAAYEDIDRADMILMIGAGLASDHPVLFHRAQAARARRGAQLILLAQGDEGRTLEVDQRIAISPGSIGTVLNGLLRHCHDAAALDLDFIERSVAVPDGFWAALQPGHDIWSVARACGLNAADLRAFYESLTETDGLVTVFGQERRSVAAAILNLHIATGRIGRLGATPFAIASAGNEMGGREVGAMADMLAAHRDFSPDARADVARFWGATMMANEPGLSGAHLLEALRTRRVRALWSLGGAMDSPWLAEALDAAAFAIVSTDRLAPELADRIDVALPSPGWCERDGTLTGADRLIGRQRRLLPLPGQARPHWWSISRVAQAMGWGPAFPYERPAEIYREHVRLTAYRNDGARLLNLRRHAPISNPAYDELTPWRWGGVPFDDGCFPTPDGRARLMRSWD